MIKINENHKAKSELTAHLKSRYVFAKIKADMLFLENLDLKQVSG